MMRRLYIPIVVWFTGGCVLVLEVVATRILSPYFGNTIFTVSSVIGVVLTALSLGYFIGGILADRYPNEKFFFGIITASGLSVLLLNVLAQHLLPLVGYDVSMSKGPLVFSVILFFPSSFLLGMLSPIAIALQASRFPTRGVGRTSGEIFCYSTVGSIAGSLSAGFFLIPRWGISRIVIGVGVVLCTLGLLSIGRRLFKRPSLFIATILAMAAMILWSLPSRARESIRFQSDGVYERLLIFDGQWNGKPARLLQQDRSNSAAVYRDSDDLAFDYTRYYALYQLFMPHLNRALVIGGGGYSIPKAILAELPEATVDVAEIEPTLVDLAKQYFRLKDDPRLRNHIVDGRRWLATASQPYDLIFSDVYYSLYSIPAQFTTKEFFELARRRLSDRGIILLNIIATLSPEPPSLFLSEMKTIRSVFPNSYFFAVTSPETPGIQNIIVVGSNRSEPVDIDALAMESNNPFLRTLSTHRIDPGRFDLTPELLLSDDYAPVEALTAAMLKRKFR